MTVTALHGQFPSSYHLPTFHTRLLLISADPDKLRTVVCSFLSARERHRKENNGFDKAGKKKRKGDKNGFVYPEVETLGGIMLACATGLSLFTQGMEGWV